MTSTVLVVTTVHHPDDTRIRQRLIESLRGAFNVVYAVRAPGPTEDGGMAVVALAGGRVRRWFGALRVLTSTRWDVAVLHDPELIPAGLLVRAMRRRRVIFDAHEDLAAQIETKKWIHSRLRPVARVLAKTLYSAADRFLEVTLAEPGYQKLFKRAWPVFPNYPLVASWPTPTLTDGAPAIYVGDVTLARGVLDAVVATGSAGVELMIVGPIPEEIKQTLVETAEAHKCDLTLVGRTTNPEALKLVAGASVGLSPLHAQPNYLQSLPTKVIEYLCVGIPVVASDLPGTNEAIGDRENVFLYPPGDTEAMSAKVIEAVGSGQRASAATNAFRMQAEYKWPAEEIVDYYQSPITR